MNSWKDPILFDRYTPQDVRCDPVNGGRILVDLSCLLEKVQAEARS